MRTIERCNTCFVCFIWAHNEMKSESESESSPANQMWFGISINYYYQELWEFYWCQIVRSKSHVNITLPLNVLMHTHTVCSISMFVWCKRKLLMALCDVSCVGVWTLPTDIHEQTIISKAAISFQISHHTTPHHTHGNHQFIQHY